MTAHTCRTLTEGCYRCELGRDEMASIDREVVLEFPHLANCDWSLGLDDECSCGLDDALLAMFRAGQAAVTPTHPSTTAAGRPRSSHE